MQKNTKGLVSYLIKNGKQDTKSWQELATSYNFSSGESARNFWLQYRKHNEIESTNKQTDYYDCKEDKKNGVTQIGFFSNKKALTDEEIFKECKIDPKKWKLDQVWHKKKHFGFTYSANFKLIIKQSIDNTKLEIENLLNNYKSKYIPLKPQDVILNSKFNDPCAVYISLTDAHLDRLTTHDRTLENATKQYLDVLELLITKAWCCNLIDEVVYVIGNDLFNSDTYFSETTAGTQQHDNVMYDQSYEKIFDMQVKAIIKLKQFCNKLHIKFVPGNHDRTKSFYLVHALEVFFKSDKNIIFDRAATNTKVYTYGENFIGMHHGDTKPEGLPLYFASKYYKEWGQAKYKEIGLGDKHVKRSWELKIKPTEEEFNGIRIFMTPSLCGNSLWEKDKEYDTSIVAGICRVYSKKEGKISEFEKRIDCKN